LRLRFKKSTQALSYTSTSQFKLHICSYDNPSSVTAPIIISDKNEILGHVLSDLINTNPGCWHDDVSGNGFIQNFGEENEQLIAATGTGSTSIVQTTEQPGNYLNVRLCFKKST
jgi:hypothetical protein